jgi:hypothetical protein
MANGTLTLYNKLTNASYVDLVIQGTFNIEDNLNDTPSNMKVKTTTSSTYREEFEVNTVAWHEDTDTWWVIKSDTSTYITTGEYEHEIELVEYLEFYGYRHLPNCAFAPNTYTLEQMLQRLFNIAKLTIAVEYATFLDEDKIMPFMSFENYTVANAIKTIARAIDAIPKMYVDTTSTYVPTLYFINRVGLDTPVVSGLNANFPTQFEKNTNSSDQFTTRAIANIQNAKSSNLVISPKSGGFKNVTPNSLTYVADNSRVFLPSKIDRVEFVRLLPKININRGDTEDDFSGIYSGYYLDKEVIKQAIISKANDFTVFTLEDLEALELPGVEELFQINYNDVLGTSYPSVFRGLFTIKNKFEFDTSEALTGDYNTIAKVKNKTIHWTPFTNELVLSKTIRDGLTLNATPDDFRFSISLASKTSGLETETIRLNVVTRMSGFLENKVPNDELLIQVGYYPIADIKISTDNDDDSQDEKFFNQNGKVIDALSASKLVFSHTQDSVNGTKIRNARYDDLEDVLPLGQLVREGNDLYVVTQRSLDLLITNEHEWVNAIYTLTKNRIGRSENITADSSVISYKTPDDNLVFRTQLYKDYIELSLVNNNQDEPYLPMNKALVFTSTLAGTNFDFTALAEWRYKPTSSTTEIVRHIANPSIFDLHKAKLLNINYQDNNVLGFRLDSTGDSYVQTPIVYTNDVGQSTTYELFLLDAEDLSNAINHFADQYPSDYDDDPLIPFGDLTQVDDNFYGNSVRTENNYSMELDLFDYDKDGFEIPVFEYMVQANDDYSPLGNVVVGDELFSTFTGTLRYHYVRNEETRFTSENAKRLYTQNPPLTSNSRRVTFARSTSTPHILDLDLFSTFSSVRNSQPITNIGIYATDGTNVKFLFAINDYVESGINDKSNIRVFINNWKI